MVSPGGYMKWFAVAALAVCAFAAPSQAETCNKPLKILSRIPLTTENDTQRLLVPADIDGKPVNLLLDTGAFASMLNLRTATALDLKLMDAPVKGYDVAGRYTDQMTEAQFKLGMVQFNKVQFMVSERLDRLNENGVIGANLLAKFDVSIDPAGRQLDLLSPDHCADAVVYWPADVVAKIPFGHDPDHKIIIDVVLDGKPLKAALDTGAENSTLFLKTAERQFGLTPGAADTPKTDKVNGEVDAYHHTFKFLTLGGVAVANPTVTLIPDQMSEHFMATSAGSRIAHTDEGMQWDMLLGMNVLRHLHLYIAYKDNMLYLTPAEPAKTK